MSLKRRVDRLEKTTNPRRRGCLVILNPDGSQSQLPAWAKGCKTFVILPAKEPAQKSELKETIEQ